MAGYINNLEDLKTWFTGNGRANWNLYRGHLGKIIPSALIFRNDQELDMDSSFDLLEEIINMNSNGGGKFTIYVPDKSSSRGVSTYVGLNLQNSAGIGSIQPFQQSGYMAIGDVDRRIAEAREKWDLENRVEDMELALEAKVPITERLLETVIAEGGIGKILEVAGTVLNGLLIKMTAPGTQVSMNGFPVQESLSNEPDKVSEEEGFSYDQEETLAVLDQIRPHFSTDEEFYTFLNAIAQKFCANPDFFKQMVLGKF